MSTIFPTWPHILFAVLEPLSLLAGGLAPLFDLHGFIAGQTPHHPSPPPPSTTSDGQELQLQIHPSTTALAYQLGNIYLLLLMLGLAVCYTTSEPRVLRNYLIALAVADLGHIYATYAAMGWESFVDVAGWGAVAWGNIGASGFLFVNRVMYLLGWFGEPKGKERAPSSAWKKGGGKKGE